MHSMRAILTINQSLFVDFNPILWPIKALIKPEVVVAISEAFDILAIIVITTILATFDKSMDGFDKSAYIITYKQILETT